jgi:hypothetical protein
MAGVDVLTAVSIVLAGCVLSLRRATWKTMACWWCWTHHRLDMGPNPCSLGDCRAP